MVATSKLHFFLTFIVLKLWTLIFSSNQAYLELARAIYYNLQKDLSNGVFYAQIGAHLTLVLNDLWLGVKFPI
jgi:hypothetical protein